METIIEIFEWAKKERDDAHSRSQKKESSGQYNAASIYFAEFQIWQEVVAKLKPLVQISNISEPLTETETNLLTEQFSVHEK